MACALAALAITPAAHADGPVRILLTGDSITNGRHGDWTWRYRLDREFHRQGVPFNFVGSRATPYVDAGYATAQYADPNFDQNHFAKAGQQLREMVSVIGPEVAADQPDVIVLEAGINDLLHGASAAQVTTSLRGWINAVRGAKPDTRVILSPVLRTDTHPELAAATDDYNTQMRGVATDLTTAASPITVADTTRGWSTTMTLDGLHPNPTGETFIAQRIAEELQAVGILPAAPQVYREVAWGHTERAVVQVSGSRANISWGHQAVTSGRARWRQSGGAWSTSALHPEAHLSIPVVRGKVYEMQVQLVRVRMTGPWGPSTRVSISALSRPVAPANVRVTRTGVRWSRSAGASSYVVKFRKVHRHRWIVRRTYGLSIGVAHVRVAQVRAVGSGGASGWRRGARLSY